MPEESLDKVLKSLLQKSYSYNELARTLGCNRKSLRNILDRHKQEGYISEEKQGKQKQIISLTKKGKKKALELVEKKLAHETLDKVWSQLSPEERRNYTLHLMDTIRKDLLHWEIMGKLLNETAEK
jgi:DNA-binding MarR family transcriptional regulator